MMLRDIKTLVFDCDGVILDSNAIKTRAFFQAALPYGVQAAQALVDWHIAHGGISRYAKFDYFLNHIVNIGKSGTDRDQLLTTYASEVHKGMMTCAVTTGLHELRKRTRGLRWLVVSGGDQVELNRIFSARNLASMFNGGIFGSPDTKVEIFARELSKGNISTPAIFFGDSKYDFESSTNAGLDFVFLTQWTDVVDYNMFIIDNQITSFYNLTEFFELENAR